MKRLIRWLCLRLWDTFTVLDVRRVSMGLNVVTIDGPFWRKPTRKEAARMVEEINARLAVLP